MNLVRANPIEKRILDCGAGGDRPPSALFSYYGYETHGLDIDKERLKIAEDFCANEGIKVSFKHGDMRDLPYSDDTFGSVFSYNTICHLSRKDTAIAMREMIRVLKPEGFLFVNFLSIDDFRYGMGEEVAPNEFIHQSLHTFFEDREPECFFESTDITWKLKSIEEFPHEGTWMRGANLVYFAQKRA
jgi:ubiquinone/menaquinone biosynthesis C-methylase UbiE